MRHVWTMNDISFAIIPALITDDDEDNVLRQWNEMKYGKLSIIENLWEILSECIGCLLIWTMFPKITLALSVKWQAEIAYFAAVSISGNWFNLKLFPKENKKKREKSKFQINLSFNCSSSRNGSNRNRRVPSPPAHCPNRHQPFKWFTSKAKAEQHKRTKHSISIIQQNLRSHHIHTNRPIVQYEHHHSAQRNSFGFFIQRFSLDIILLFWIVEAINFANLFRKK